MIDSNYMSNPQEWAAGHEGFHPNDSKWKAKPGWHDDVSSFFYYGSFGLLDPKMPAEARGYQKLFKLAGWRGFTIGAGISMAGGFLLAGTLGWAFDPADRREGGIVEWESYQEHVDPHVQDFSRGLDIVSRWIRDQGHPDYYFM